MDEKDVIIARQQEVIARLTAQVEQLQAEIVRLKKNSSNSSKPPSSDIVKPKPAKPRRKGKRKRGGQFGHRKHVRPALVRTHLDRPRHLRPQGRSAFEFLLDSLAARWADHPAPSLVPTNL